MPKLTTAAIARYRPSGKRREIRDAAVKGLYLVIQPTGSKSFCMRFCRPDGTPSKLTLGPLDLTGTEMPEEPVIGQPLTLAGAHEIATKVHRQRAMGRDVIAEQAAAKHRRHIEAEQDAANTFAVLVAKFITEHAQRKTRRWRHTARFLGLRYPKDGGEPEVITGGLCDRWASRSVREIDGSDVYAVVDETRRLGVPGLTRQKDGLTDAMARAVLSAMSGFFSWCQQHRRVALNPCVGVYRPEPSKKRDRVLTNDELVKFWHASHELGEPVGQALRLLLLTGCRLREVSEMQHSELSEDVTTWVIPSERTKNHLAHVVPLPPLARQTIASLKPIAGKFVFTLSGKKPICISSTLKHELDALMNIPAWTLHDLRRTAATGIAGIGIPPHIVEACLNHVSGAKASVAGVYNRAAYEPEKKAALQRWASHLERLVSGQTEDNIVDHPARKRGK